MSFVKGGLRIRKVYAIITHLAGFLLTAKMQQLHLCLWHPLLHDEKYNNNVLRISVMSMVYYVCRSWANLVELVTDRFYTAILSYARIYRINIVLGAL